MGNFFLGAFSISMKEFVDFLSSNANELVSGVLIDLRLPRILLSSLVGMAFGICGVIMQTMFKNPLADPSLIGVASGASAGVVLMMLFLPSFENGIVIAAFLGSAITIVLVYRLSITYGKVSVVIMLLSGIAINALLGALIGVFSYVSDDASLRSFTFWTLGSFSASSYEALFYLLPINIVVFGIVMWKKNSLNLLLLGEDEAKNAGVNVEVLKKILIVCVALGIGVSVAYCGIIGFVGLVVPHISRLLVGANHRFLLPLSAILGALTMLWADTISRTVIAPAELPIGIITALIGAPFFMWLLLASKKELF